jgi:hypothetical protein
MLLMNAGTRNNSAVRAASDRGERGHQDGGLPSDVLRPRHEPRKVRVKGFRPDVVGNQPGAGIHGDEKTSGSCWLRKSRNMRGVTASIPICDTPEPFAAARFAHPGRQQASTPES